MLVYILFSTFITNRWQMLQGENRTGLYLSKIVFQNQTVSRKIYLRYVNDICFRRKHYLQRYKLFNKKQTDNGFFVIT